MFAALLRHPVLSARAIARRVTEIPSKGLPRVRRRPVDDEFDRKYGVDTAQILQITPTSSPNFSHGNKYEATGEQVIRWSIERCGLPPADTTFIDYGCGKGRVIMMAAMSGFRRVVGIEYSPDLAA